MQTNVCVFLQRSFTLMGTCTQFCGLLFSFLLFSNHLKNVNNIEEYATQRKSLSCGIFTPEAKLLCHHSGSQRKSNREKKFIIQKKTIKLFESLLKSLFFSLQLFPSFYVCVSVHMCACTCPPPHSTDRHSGPQLVTITSSIAINSFMNIHFSAQVTVLQHRFPEVKRLYQHLSDMHLKLYQILQNCLRQQFALSRAVKETIFTFALTWCY